MRYIFPIKTESCYRWILLLFFPLLSFLPVNAQKYFFDNYGVAEGLSSSKVYTIFQDHNDLVWLGTEVGVSRFDGKEFKDFTSEQGMAENGVFAILEDSHDNLWFGHLDGGITRYDGHRFEVIRFDSITINGDITSFTETQDHKIWITTSASGALLVEHPFGPAGKMKIRQYLGRKGLSDRIFNAYHSKDNRYFCLSDVGVHLYLPAKDSFEIFPLKPFTHYFMKTCMLEDREGNFWFGTYHGGLYEYSKKRDTLRIFDSKRNGLAHNWISCLLEDNQGTLWVGTWGGGITRIRDGKLKTYNDRNGLQDNYIKCLVEDHEGNIIIGTQYHGMSIFKGEEFIVIDKADGLGNPTVSAIYQDSDHAYWFGTNEGITVYDPSKEPDRRFSYFSRRENGIENIVRFIVNDSREHLWIGTYQGGIFEYDPVRNQFYYDTYLNNRYLYRDLIITALVVDKNDHVWAGTNDGVTYFEPETKQGTRYSQGDGLVGNGITALYYDRGKDKLWIGSERKKGLTCYDFRTRKFERKILSKKITPLAITSGPDGTLWLGTNVGLFAYNGDSLTLHLTEEDGLLANRVNLVNTDKKGNIYIGTSKGLNKYIPDRKQMVVYTRRNGFVGIETQRNATFRDRQGYLWFGTANGAIRYDPGFVRKINAEPLTHIRSIEVNYEPRPMVPGMKLSYYEKSIIFHYYSISLTNPDAVRYQVMLKGADAGWRPVTTETRATYSALSPGHYTFMVKAKNSEGIWNSRPVTFSFTIRPPFYLTWWFISLVIILAGLGIWSYIKIRERNLIREKLILEEKVIQRTAEVVEKSKELEEKNRDITDSIRYAKRIQNAILPPEDEVPGSFVLFKPKDIVSGDFYWYNDPDTKLFIAAVDCTGHGVPGAFMSFIGYNSLNKIVNEYHITEAASILDHLNDEIYRTLHVQSRVEEVKDGMDLALVVYDRKTRILEYAGAHNPLYLIRNDELQEIKADRFSIGMTSMDQGRKFTNHEITIVPGDMIYIFSDGYADQFGGPDGKKFKSRQMKELFLTINQYDLEKQRQILDDTIEKWRGHEAQIDDILVIGMKFE